MQPPPYSAVWICGLIPLSSHAMYETRSESQGFFCRGDSEPGQVDKSPGFLSQKLNPHRLLCGRQQECRRSGYHVCRVQVRTSPTNAGRLGEFEFRCLDFQRERAYLTHEMLRRLFQRCEVAACASRRCGCTMQSVPIVPPISPPLCSMYHTWPTRESGSFSLNSVAAINTSRRI